MIHNFDVKKKIIFLFIFIISSFIIQVNAPII